VVIAIGYVILIGLASLRGEPLAGWAILAAGWFGILAWLTFFFRLLGLWCFRSRVEAA